MRPNLKPSVRTSRIARCRAATCIATVAVAALAGGGGGVAHAADPFNADAALAMLKRNDCGKCHSVDKKKEGPSYKEIAMKLKGKAGAEDQIVKHLTTSPKVKVDDKEEEHKAVKVADEAEVRNLAKWILAR